MTLYEDVQTKVRFADASPDDEDVQSKVRFADASPDDSLLGGDSFASSESVTPSQASDDITESKWVEEVKKGGRTKHKQGCIVDMSDAIQSLPSNAFEIGHSATYDPTGGGRKFAFHHCSRKSILLGLGQAPGLAENDSSGTLRVYMKMSDTFCMWTYMAILIGPGTLDVSKAFNKTGLFPGIFGVVLLTVLHIFLCHRIIEIPRLVEQDLETFSDMARVVFNKAGWVIVGIYTVVGWFSSCFVYAVLLRKFMKPLFEERSWFWMSIISLSLCAGLMVVMVLQIGGNNAALQRCATISIFTMLFASGLECSCAIVHGIANFNVENTFVWFGAASDILHGWIDLSFGFCGICILPYIVAVMREPEHAKKVLTKASVNIGLLYAVVGVVGDFGWTARDTSGDANALMAIYQLGDLYTSVARCISLLVSIKIMTVFPILFWPLFREIDCYMHFDEAPELDLGLPWAVRRVKRQKIVLRFVLCALTLTPLYMPGTFMRNLKRFMLDVPIATFFFLVPASLAVGAIVTHQRIGGSRKYELFSTFLGDTQDKPYFRKNLKIHTIFTIALTLVLFVFSSYRFSRFLLWLTSPSEDANTHSEAPDTMSTA